MMDPAAMVTVKLRYVHQDIDRHGNVRTYFWRKGGPKVRIRESVGSQAFLDVYRGLLAESQSGKLTPAKRHNDLPEPGTYRWLCVEYFKSTRFMRLDPRTQTSSPESARVDLRGADLSRCGREIWRLPAVEVHTQNPSGPSGPQGGTSGGWKRAGEADPGYVRLGSRGRAHLQNPARDVPLTKTGSTGFHTWDVGEVEKFEQRHPIGTKARLALALLMWTGARRSDVVLLGKQHVRDGWLKFTQQKNRNRTPVTIEIPILAELQRIIDASPTGDLTFLVSERGRPFAVSAFGNWFRTRCDEAGLPQCSAHGLRKAGATVAAENGATAAPAHVDLRLGDVEGSGTLHEDGPAQEDGGRRDVLAW